MTLLETGQVVRSPVSSNSIPAKIPMAESANERRNWISCDQHCADRGAVGLKRLLGRLSGCIYGLPGRRRFCEGRFHPKNRTHPLSQFPAVESINGKVSGAWVLKGPPCPSHRFSSIWERAPTSTILWNGFQGLDREQIEAVIEFAARSLDVNPLLCRSPLLEMFRRALPIAPTRECLYRLSNRLTKILSEAPKLTMP